MKSLNVVLVLALLFGGVGAQTGTPVYLPTPSSSASNLTFLDGQQYINGGHFGQQNFGYWGYVNFFSLATNTLLLGQVSQSVLGYPNFDYYYATAYSINATSFYAIYAGTSSVLTNFTISENTTYGPRLSADFEIYDAGAPFLGGTAQLAPVKYALEVINSTASSNASEAPPTTVNRTEISTTYIFQGSIDGQPSENFTGVGSLQSTPTNGVVDNTTVILDLSLRVNSPGAPPAGAFEKFLGTGTPTEPGNFASFNVLFAGSVAGTMNFTVSQLTSDGPILNGSYTVHIFGSTATGSIKAYPIKYALRVVDIPLRRRRVRRLVEGGRVVVV